MVISDGPIRSTMPSLNYQGKNSGRSKDILMVKMDTTKRVAKNTIALYIADVITAILSIILSIVIARQLGDVVFGKYSFAIYFVALLTQFADIGYMTLSLREIARDKSQASKYLSNNLSISTVYP
jgi:O-antigen/teichoic acid export membrane protein